MCECRFKVVQVLRRRCKNSMDWHLSSPRHCVTCSHQWEVSFHNTLGLGAHHHDHNGYALWFNHRYGSKPRHVDGVPCVASFPHIPFETNHVLDEDFAEVTITYCPQPCNSQPVVFPWCLQQSLLDCNSETLEKCSCQFGWNACPYIW